MEALAFDSGKAEGVNVEASNNSAAGYVKSTLVSLASARRENPGCDIALYCNEPIAAKYAKVADRLGVKVRVVPFDDYVFKSGLTWRLAFYKLCALKHALGEGYDSICLMDTDTWSRGPVTDLLGSQGGVFMVGLESHLADKDRVAMEQAYSKLGLGWERVSFPTCWGGEFVCGDARGLEALIDGCDKVYARMCELGVSSERGDEFLLYASANRVGFPVYCANAYVRRVWTGRYFTPCRHESYVVLHLPAEKNFAFPRAWKSLEQGTLPSTEKFSSWCGLHPSKRPLDLAWATARVLQKAGVTI